VVHESDPMSHDGSTRIFFGTAKSLAHRVLGVLCNVGGLLADLVELLSDGRKQDCAVSGFTCVSFGTPESAGNVCRQICSRGWGLALALALALTCAAGRGDLSMWYAGTVDDDSECDESRPESSQWIIRDLEQTVS